MTSTGPFRLQFTSRKDASRGGCHVFGRWLLFHGRRNEGIPAGIDLGKGQWVVPADGPIGSSEIGIPPRGTQTDIVFSAGKPPDGFIVKAKIVGFPSAARMNVHPEDPAHDFREQ